MPGEPVVLTSDQGGQIRSLVNALARFPTEPEWTVVGGFAVYVRITDVHRVTNDLDTVSRNQSSLVEVLVAEPDADRLAAAKLRINQDGTEVVVDVMDDTSGKPLPNEPGARAFALARRMALSQSLPGKLTRLFACWVGEGVEEASLPSVILTHPAPHVYAQAQFYKCSL